MKLMLMIDYEADHEFGYEVVMIIPCLIMLWCLWLIFDDMWWCVWLLFDDVWWCLWLVTDVIWWYMMIWLRWYKMKYMTNVGD
jgi:hypothetical protein